MAFFVLAFGLSWTLWLPATLGDSPALLLLVCLLATIIVLLTGPQLSREPRVRETART